jgi:hypothetical protein
MVLGELDVEFFEHLDGDQLISCNTTTHLVPAAGSSDFRLGCFINMPLHR